MKDPLSRLLLQVIIIVLATRAVGTIFVRCGQPAVIGEVLAGILVGPSLLGWVWPEAAGFIFPKESLGVLKLFSQIGVCLFMFVVGLELQVSHLRQKAHTAVVVSHASIMFPYLLGVVAALFLYSHYAAPGGFVSGVRVVHGNCPEYHGVSCTGAYFGRTGHRENLSGQYGNHMRRGG